MRIGFAFELGQIFSEKRLLTWPRGFCRAYIFVVLYLVHSASIAAAPSPAEIKAGLIYNLLRYTAWPNKADDIPVTLCVFGSSGDVATNLILISDSYKSQSVLKVKPITEAEEVINCDAVYFNIFEDRIYKEWLKINDTKVTLTLSDIEHFTKRGGDIEIANWGGRYGFQIALKRVLKKNIKISSLVLDLSKISSDKELMQ